MRGDAVMYKVLLFDFDGVIVQTEAWYMRQQAQALEQMGIRCTKADLAALMGANYMTRPAAMDRCFAGQEAYRKNRDEIVKYRPAKINPDWKALVTPHLEELLSFCRDHHIPMSVATNSGSDRIVDALNTLGISKYFRSIYSGLETGHPKPDPYIYTLGIEDAGCLPSQAMVIEDSRTGIEGAKASGAFVTALRDPDGIADQSFADAIVTDLRDVIPLLRQ